MFVKMLTAMAGDSFSYDHGAVVEVEAKMGKAWIKAGIAEAAPDSEALKTQLATASDTATQANARIAELEAEVERLTAELEALKAPPADETPPAEGGE